MSSDFGGDYDDPMFDPNDPSHASMLEEYYDELLAQYGDDLPAMLQQAAAGDQGGAPDISSIPFVVTSFADVYDSCISMLPTSPEVTKLYTLLALALVINLSSRRTLSFLPAYAGTLTSLALSLVAFAHYSGIQLLSFLIFYSAATYGFMQVYTLTLARFNTTAAEQEEEDQDTPSSSAEQTMTGEHTTTTTITAATTTSKRKTFWWEGFLASPGVVWLVASLFLIVCLEIEEISGIPAATMGTLRGPIMIAVMKAVSLQFDLDHIMVQQQRQPQDEPDENDVFPSGDSSKQNGDSSNDNKKQSNGTAHNNGKSSTNNNGKVDKTSTIVNGNADETYIEEALPENQATQIDIDILSFLSYMLCLTSAFFGPWIPYAAHCRMIGSDDAEIFINIYANEPPQSKQPSGTPSVPKYPNTLMGQLRRANDFTLLIPAHFRYNARYFAINAAGLLVWFPAAIGCLLFSTCVMEWILPDLSGSERYANWLKHGNLLMHAVYSYRDAMSFRFSHYFVSFLGQALLMAAGYRVLADYGSFGERPSQKPDTDHPNGSGSDHSSNGNDKTRHTSERSGQNGDEANGSTSSANYRNKTKQVRDKELRKERGKIKNNYDDDDDDDDDVRESWSDMINEVLTETVTRPLEIELPRSLVGIVTSWNLPMHAWLKSYIFNPLHASTSSPFKSIIGTYVVSAALHGFNFQLSSVLLSLGIYSYAEYTIREKLAIAYSACVRAKACPNRSISNDDDDDNNRTSHKRPTYRNNKPRSSKIQHNGNNNNNNSNNTDNRRGSKKRRNNSASKFKGPTLPCGHRHSWRHPCPVCESHFRTPGCGPPCLSGVRVFRRH